MEGRLLRPDRQGAGHRRQANLDRRQAPRDAVVDRCRSNTAPRSPSRCATRRRSSRKISYEKDVSPILAKNCVACHSEGGIGPFAMDSYEKVKGFSGMIREAIRTDRMPPYNADPHVSQFTDDMNLLGAGPADADPLDRGRRPARRRR